MTRHQAGGYAVPCKKGRQCSTCYGRQLLAAVSRRLPVANPFLRGGPNACHLIAVDDGVARYAREHARFARKKTHNAMGIERRRCHFEARDVLVFRSANKIRMCTKWISRFRDQHATHSENEKQTFRKSHDHHQTRTFLSSKVTTHMCQTDHTILCRRVYIFLQSNYHSDYHTSATNACMHLVCKLSSLPPPCMSVKPVDNSVFTSSGFCQPTANPQPHNPSSCCHQTSMADSAPATQPPQPPTGSASRKKGECVLCGETATYQPDGCGCSFTYCKAHAMKLATGGRCKSCKAFFGGMRLSTA